MLFKVFMTYSMLVLMLCTVGLFTSGNRELQAILQPVGMVAVCGIFVFFIIGIWAKW